MIKHFFTAATVSAMLLAMSTAAAAQMTAVPEQFTGSSPGSTFSIKYDDVNELLRKTVVNTGRSTREKSDPRKAATGTRMKISVKRATVNEANRFYFEAFKNDDDATAYLQSVKKSLEVIPEQVELAAFSRDEQLAYWLNLYNITMIDEIIQIYPKKDLKKVLTGKKSVLNKKVLTVDGVSLSLNDIKFILRKNYNNNPLVIYGMYQGNIGSPNIRRVAYSGSNVYQGLQDNAEEFVNSNRGTYSKGKGTFYVSNVYERDAAFFANDEALKTHLLTLVQSPEKEELQTSSSIKRNINDWTITDLYGSERDLGGSFASSKSALIDSVTSSQPTEVVGQSVSTSFSHGSGVVTQKAPSEKRFSADLVARLQEINAKRGMTAKGNATVTVEELGEVEVEPTQPEKDDNQ